MRGWPSMIGVFWPRLRTVTLDKATFRNARVRADYAAGKTASRRHIRPAKLAPILQRVASRSSHPTNEPVK